jgi:hypothetical protein
MVEQEQNIGKEFYLFESAKYYENIYRVKLDSISKRKIRNKDEYEIFYNFKFLSEKNDFILKGFQANTNPDNPYLFRYTKTIDNFIFIYYYIYSLDNEFILDEINKKKINTQIKKVIIEIDSILNSYKENQDVNKQDVNKLEKVLNFMKSLNKENI